MTPTYSGLHFTQTRFHYTARRLNMKTFKALLDSDCYFVVVTLLNELLKVCAIHYTPTINADPSLYISFHPPLT